MVRLSLRRSKSSNSESMETQSVGGKSNRSTGSRVSQKIKVQSRAKVTVRASEPQYEDAGAASFEPVQGDQPDSGSYSEPSGGRQSGSQQLQRSPSKGSKASSRHGGYGDDGSGQQQQDARSYQSSKKSISRSRSQGTVGRSSYQSSKSRYGDAPTSKTYLSVDAPEWQPTSGHAEVIRPMRPDITPSPNPKFYKFRDDNRQRIWGLANGDDLQESEVKSDTTPIGNSRYHRFRDATPNSKDWNLVNGDELNETEIKPDTTPMGTNIKNYNFRSKGTRQFNVVKKTAKPVRAYFEG